MRRWPQAPSLLPCYWHQHELFCARYLLLQMPRGLKLGFLVSPSVDGEVPAMIARRLGAQVIRGSSTHTGAKALRDYYQLLVNESVSPVITPDGPTGPPLRFKPGGHAAGADLRAAAAAHGLRGVERLAFGWDNFVMPRPGSRIAIAIGAPVRVDRTVALGQGDVLERGSADWSRNWPCCCSRRRRRWHESLAPGPDGPRALGDHRPRAGGVRRGSGCAIPGRRTSPSIR